MDESTPSGQLEDTLTLLLLDPDTPTVHAGTRPDILPTDDDPRV